MRPPAVVSSIALAVALTVLTACAQTNPNLEPAHGTVSASQEFDDCSGAGWCPRMVIIPAGSFTMGSSMRERDRFDDAWHGITGRPTPGYFEEEGPQHIVSMPGFAVGKFEVTFDQWDACASGGGCSSNSRPNDQGWGRGQRPVVNVSWNDAQEYVQWLSSATHQSYRLLTEAEWEYAARARTTTAFSWGDSIRLEQAQYSLYNRYLRDPPHTIERTSTVAAGSFAPNGFGLYDVHGNADEWVEDCWNENYNGAPTNGAAWTTGDCSRRVQRGGAWVSVPASLRSASRGPVNATSRLNVFGFRIARTASTSLDRQ